MCNLNAWNRVWDKEFKIISNGSAHWYDAKSFGMKRDEWGNDGDDLMYSTVVVIIVIVACVFIALLYALYELLHP